jgi:hypothetical protein
VEALVKHGEVGGHYVLRLTDGRTVHIGDAKILTSQRAFAIAVFDGLSFQLPPIPRKKWALVLDALLAVQAVVHTLRADEMVREWLDSYVQQSSVQIDSLDGDATMSCYALYTLQHHNAAVIEKKPGGRVILRLRSLYMYVSRTYDAKLSMQNLAHMLSVFGFKMQTTIASPTVDGRRIKVNRVWIGPNTLLDGAPDREADRWAERAASAHNW